MSLLSPFSFLLSFVTLVSLAHGYSLRTNKDGKVLLWSQKKVKVLLDTSVVKEVGGAADAVRAGFVTWIASGVPLNITFKEGPKGVLAADGTNAVLWQTADWKYGKEVVAMTVTMYKRSSATVTETDIVLNGRDHSWTVTPPAGCSAYDIQNVVAHEAGHFFGLGHSDSPEATMFPTTPGGETAKRSLSADDRAGIVALIEEINQRSEVKPSGDDSPVRRIETQSTNLIERRTAGCSAGGVSSRASGWACWWPIMVLGLLTCPRRRRRSCAAMLFTWTLCLSPAHASVVHDLTLEELALRSTTVVQGTVIQIQSHVDPDSGLIVTDHTLAVIRCYKVSRPCRTMVTMRTLGGEIGDRGLLVRGMPRLKVGQRLVLFARGTHILRSVGLSLGVFLLSRPPDKTPSEPGDSAPPGPQQVLRDLRGLDLVRDGRRVRGGIERHTLRQLEERLRRANVTGRIRDAFLPKGSAPGVQ